MIVEIGPAGLTGLAAGVATLAGGGGAPLRLMKRKPISAAQATATAKAAMRKKRPFCRVILFRYAPIRRSLGAAWLKRSNARTKPGASRRRSAFRFRE